MSKPLIAVTGRNGQLGYELEQIKEKYQNDFDFLFTDRHLLDLTNPSTIPEFFALYKPAYFINCAAYTAVDKAETDKENAQLVNAISVGVIAEQTALYHCRLITISTDYVFNGNGTSPYPTDAPIEPVNYYGLTKAEGEHLARTNDPSSIIIRTSWVYSVHGNNFVKTMMRLMKDRKELNVVGDQFGCPTNAADLAEAIMLIIVSINAGNKHAGIYHYSNSGKISWADFAKEISAFAKMDCKVISIPSSAYPTPAKRPAYSVMNTDSITTDFGVEIKNWKSSLHNCVKKLLSLN